MRWPLAWRSDVDAAKTEADRQRERAEKAENTASTEVAARREIGHQLAEADAANRRLDGRNRALAEQLKTAQTKSGFDKGRAEMTARRIARLRKAVASARAEVAKARRQGPAGMASELHRSEKARAALDSQISVLQRSNEAQARELYDLRHGGDAS